MSGLRGPTAAVLTLVGAAMLTAGPVLVIRGGAGRKLIRRELTEQKIAFPDGGSLPAELAPYGRVQVTNGEQAKAFADLIGANVLRATGGRTYSEVSHDLLVAGGEDTKLADLRQTAFMGQTLRASLMSAYQAWNITTLVVGLGALFTGMGTALVMTGLALGGYGPARDLPLPRSRIAAGPGTRVRTVRVRHV